MANPTETKSMAAVYVGWGTFRNTVLDGLASEDLPHQIDRTIFGGLAGGVQSQLIAGLRFLGLTDEAGKPTATFHDLVSPDEAHRKQKFAAIMKERYAELIALGLEKASLAQVAAKMEEAYAVSGDTRERAVRFFIAAAQYSGIVLSRHILATKSTGSAARKRAASARRSPVDDRDAPPDDDGEEARQPPPPSGTARTVELLSGGSLTLHASIDLFKMNADDRKFVFDLIDKLAEYEMAVVQKQAAPEKSPDRPIEKPANGKKGGSA